MQENNYWKTDTLAMTEEMCVDGLTQQLLSMYNDVPVKSVDVIQLQSNMEETAHKWGFQCVDKDMTVHFGTTEDGSPLITFYLLHIACTEYKIDVCLNILINNCSDNKDYAEVKVFKIK